MYIINGTIYTMDRNNTVIEKGAIRIKDGILVEVGRMVSVEEQEDRKEQGGQKEQEGQGEQRIKAESYADIPVMEIVPETGEKVLDAQGGWILPGFVEAHCHLGIQEEKKGMEGNDCNEAVNPITPWLRALDAINPMDSAFMDAIRAGITCVQVGPGSSNVVGGQFLVMKTAGRCIDQMVVKAPSAMKVAFGENPKVNYSEQEKSPTTRMAIAGMLRKELFEAKAYWEKRRAQQADFEVDFTKECWLPVFDGKIPLKAHVHRADDIFTAIRIAKEFGFSMTLDHCSEGHLIAGELAQAGYPAIIGPDLTSRNKIEVQNAAFKTVGILHKAGVTVTITTDHPVCLIQTLPICAGLAVKAGLPFMAGLRAITIEAARIAGVEERVGSLETGKDADISIFTTNPMEIMAETLYTIIDGKVVYSYQDKSEGENIV